MIATIISYPSKEIDETIDIDDTNEATEIVRNIFIPPNLTTNDDIIEITYNGEVITLLITDECRYTPIDIAFQNKEGQMQILTFFKAKTDSMSVTDETFESVNQFRRFNVNGRSKFKASSGFVDESMNETFKQLLLSERVWLYGNQVFTPLNVASKSIEYKTRQKDRLINYEIDFDYAFNEIN
jgi:hypothetical protein